MQRGKNNEWKAKHEKEHCGLRCKSGKYMPTMRMQKYICQRYKELWAWAKKSKRMPAVLIQIPHSGNRSERVRRVQQMRKNAAKHKVVFRNKRSEK